ncbi:MAG: glycosyltransferase, partial [Gammaproteobacteria bacterium]
MFCLFAYRPYGGLQQSFLRIAESCRKRGHRIQVLTMEWQGPARDDMGIEVIPVRRLRNHARSKAFATAVQRRVNEQEFDLVIGFNRMPGLDIYYAADPCYEARVRRLRNRAFRLTGRYRHFAAFERAVFGPGQNTQIITLAESEIPNFVRYYQTPRERFHVLPPGIARDRCAPPDAEEIRQRFRAQFGFCDSDFVVLMVGSGFKTKG